ncbi:MAG: HAD family hydrolase [Chloroflexota bacterium]
MNITKKAIFLDRDGVIIENQAAYVRSWDDVFIFPQAIAALAKIAVTPYKIILVTNQSVVGRGIISLAAAQAINEHLVNEIEKVGGRVDDVLMCPHAPSDDCSCRKPKPGLLLQATQHHHLALTQSLMIGDALTDVEAGQRAGIGQVGLVQTGRGVEQLRLPRRAELRPFSVFADLAEALATWIK